MGHPDNKTKKYYLISIIISWNIMNVVILSLCGLKPDLTIPSSAYVLYMPCSFIYIAAIFTIGLI